MKYAVINLGGSQHQVELDSKLVVNDLGIEVGSLGTNHDVLLTVSDKKVDLGTPNVSSASVEYKVLRNFLGKKIRVFKYKSKSRTRKTKGHRDKVTEIQITKLNF